MNKIKIRIKNLKEQLLNSDTEMTDQVFWDNEIRANLQISKTMFLMTIMMLLVWILNMAGVLAIQDQYAMIIFPVAIVALVVPATISVRLRGEKSWIKYMLLLSVSILLAYLDSILIFNVPLLILFPVVFSCRYYSRKLTIRIVVFSSVLFAVSAYVGAVTSYGNPDLNFASETLSGYIHNIMLVSFLPRWLLFVVLSVFCYEITLTGRKMVLEQHEISLKTARVDTELRMAERIQAQALPVAADFPLSRCRAFDLAAKMTPAKEVGGDFYDFFYPDPTHLAMIIADVADKGIAASLYMMMSKTLLDSWVDMDLSPGSVLENVNRQLYLRSPRGMFVTVWLGVLNLKTGDLVSASAGHEYPAICRRDGTFELIRDKHGFVLAGRKNTRYPETTTRLEEGDTLFVYTDGVVEAHNAAGEMFGEERMLESLNRHGDGDMARMIAGLEEDIATFADSAPQFDDMTMLAFRMKEPLRTRGIQLKPVIGEMYAVQEYIKNTIGPGLLTPIQTQRIEVAVDEVFSNIVNYSNATEVEVICEADERLVQIIFRDNGAPFDPVTRPDKPASERKKIGGLGIMITKQMMDNVSYRREEGMNSLNIGLYRARSE